MQMCIVVNHLSITQVFDYMSFLKGEFQVMQKTAPNGAPPCRDMHSVYRCLWHLPAPSVNACDQPHLVFQLLGSQRSFLSPLHKNSPTLTWWPLPGAHFKTFTKESTKGMVAFVYFVTVYHVYNCVIIFTTFLFLLLLLIKFLLSSPKVQFPHNPVFCCIVWWFLGMHELWGEAKVGLQCKYMKYWVYSCIITY